MPQLAPGRCADASPPCGPQLPGNPTLEASGCRQLRSCVRVQCGSSGGHLHRACVLLGAALHRKLDPHTDLKDLVDMILRLLPWDSREAGDDETILCLRYELYAPSCDVIAAGSRAGKLSFINAHTGEKIVCPVRGHSEDNEERTCTHGELLQWDCT